MSQLVNKIRFSIAKKLSTFKKAVFLGVFCWFLLNFLVFLTKEVDLLGFFIFSSLLLPLFILGFYGGFKLKEKIEPYLRLNRAIKKAFWVWFFLAFVFLNFITFLPFEETTIIELLILFLLTLPILPLLTIVFYLGIMVIEKISLYFKPDLKLAILISFYIWFFFALILFFLVVVQHKELVSLYDFPTIFEWIISIATGTQLHFWEPLFYNFFLNIFFLIPGFYFGIKFFQKKHKIFIFVFPLISSVVISIFESFSLIRFIQDAEVFGFYFAFLPFIIFQKFLIYSSLPLIVAVLFYLTKEKKFLSVSRNVFKIFTIFLFLMPIISLAMTKKTEIEFSKIKQKAIQSVNLTLCEELKIKEERSFYPLQSFAEKYYYPCITQIAIKLSDIKICNRLNTWFKNREKGAYGFSEAIVKKCQKEVYFETTKQCKDVKDSKETCVEEFALQKGDEKMCEIIFNHGCKEEMILRGKKSEIELCKQKEKSEIKKCITEIALKTESSSICEAIPPEFDNTDCYLNLALKLNDIKICKKIWNDYTKNSCIKEVAINTRNSKACEEISESLSLVDRDNCFEEIALLLHDSSLCEKIKTEYTKRNCFEQLKK